MVMSINSELSQEQTINTVLPERYYGDELLIKAVGLSQAGTTIPDTLHFVRPSIKTDDYERALEDIARTLTVIEGECPDGTVNQFEVGIANFDGDLSDLDPDAIFFDAEDSTYNSALSSNAGNVEEFAKNAAVNPEKPRIYIASPGNGFSSYLTRAERAHLRKTGQLIDGNDGVYEPVALPIVKSLSHALQRNNITIDRISANSAGSNLARAMMFDLPENQITHAYLKGPTNIVDQNALALGYRMLVKENIVANGRNRKLTRDEWALTDDKIDAAKEKLAPRVEELKETYGKLGMLATLRKLATDGISYSRGAKPGQYSPALEETQCARKKQPEAYITYHFGLEDQQYQHQYETLVNFILGITTEMDLDPSKVQGLIVPGSHADHTSVPSIRWGVETYAFNR
jgi:hypothetical protein